MTKQEVIDEGVKIICKCPWFNSYGWTKEDWSWQYERLTEVAQSYDIRKGKLYAFLTRSFVSRSIDILRHNTALIRGGGHKKPLHLDYDPPSSRVREAVSVELKYPTHLDWEISQLTARGLSMRQIALVLTMPLGTVKTRLNKMRYLNTQLPSTERRARREAVSADQQRRAALPRSRLVSLHPRVRSGAAPQPAGPQSNTSSEPLRATPAQPLP